MSQSFARRAAAAAVIAAGALTLAPGVASAKSHVQTLRYKTRLTKLTEVPVAGQTKRAPQPGDYVVITDEYLRHGKVIGTDAVHCLLITTKESLCTVAVELPRGELELQGLGPAGGSGHFTIAITGGTRAYADARGTATIISGKHNTGTEIFRIRR